MVLFDEDSVLFAVVLFTTDFLAATFLSAVI
jgi:hypothetical protein